MATVSLWQTTTNFSGIKWGSYLLTILEWNRFAFSYQRIRIDCIAHEHTHICVCTLKRSNEHFYCYVPSANYRQICQYLNGQRSLCYLPEKLLFITKTIADNGLQYCHLAAKLHFNNQFKNAAFHTNPASLFNLNGINGFN